MNVDGKDTQLVLQCPHCGGDIAADMPEDSTNFALERLLCTKCGQASFLEITTDAEPAVRPQRKP
jgi:ribosomal protein S27AE